MRVTVVLLAAIAVSFASAATNADQNSLSTKTSLGLVDPIDGTLGDINNNGKRFLRRQKPSEDDDADVDDSDVDEERINASKLRDLVSGKTSKQFDHWGKQKTLAFKSLGQAGRSQRDESQKGLRLVLQRHLPQRQLASLITGASQRRFAPLVIGPGS
ncbi:hypothetical protein F444_22609 [Phytophthora nicotianae P1976]|uniref:RxLR effector protein n=1 Tax=Phytophthora nicotianae P1976 TaxID=1317066 RepID=A0A080YXA2_PHYNI|nr:hypothetical protein F444_22609 [Phytophthora nicotianae P1976]